MQLKKELGDTEFSSQTDSEVIAHLLAKLHKDNPLDSLREVCLRLRGSYALAVIFCDQPDKIFVARKNSPVVVGCGGGRGVVCSDINSTRDCPEIFVLEEENLAVVEANKVQIYDFNLNKLRGVSVKFEKDIEGDSLQSYPHFMLKEIDEVSKVLRQTMQKYLKIDDFSLIFDEKRLKNVEMLLIVGCGTAYNAGRIGGEIIERECKIKVECQLASELTGKTFLQPPNTLAIFVSQSGETADTLRAVEFCKEHGLKTLAVTNVKNSSISRVCDFVLYTHAGKEVAVASTKAFNCQVAVLYLFASYLKSLKEDVDYVEEESTRLLEVSNQIEGLEIDGQCQEIANLIGGEKSIYMIGRGLDYLLAKESALKLKEITYIHCEAFPAGELKHGTISLIEEGTIVFAFATCKQTLPKMLSSIKEVQSRGARVILLTQFDDIQEAFLTIKLKSLPEKYMPLYAVVYMQKIAYYTSTALGNNPDKPRSLAKSVTVE